MRIPVAWLKRYGAPLALCGALLALSQPVKAQSDDKDLIRLDRRINTLIRSIDDIKWQNITIYKLEEEFKARLIKSLEAEDKADIEYVELIGQTIYDDPLPDFAEKVKQLASSARTQNGRNYPQFKAALAQAYNIDPDYLDDTELQNALARMMSVIQRRASRPREFYLVTSRDKNAPRLIALLGAQPNESGGSPVLLKVWAGTDLYSYLTSNGPDSTMYSELKGAIADGSSNLSNQMFVLRDLSEIVFSPATMVRATYLDEEKYGYVLTAISAGRPLRSDYVADTAAATDDGGMFGNGGGGGLFDDMFSKKSQNKVEGAEIPGTAEHPYEITVGTDVIASFITYELKDKKIPEPQWGVELVNNFDQINYPSIWGGRLTLNAILENIKIGAVLPQIRFGDSTLATSGIGSSQQKVFGGYGLALSGDFTASMLDNSGLFNFYTSYTFSESETDKWTLKTFRPGGEVDNEGEKGYLIRYAAQMNYSFGFYADGAARHMFRLKVGGSVYGVDTYVREQDLAALVTRPERADTPTTLTKLKSETVGGVSGAVEYMKGGQKIPYGASLQYFDQTLLANVWLQFIVTSSLDLKVGLKYFAPIIRDLHPWENRSLVVPSVSLKYHFGL